MKHRILSLLVLLLTAASGAWADETPLVTITIDSDGNPVYSESGLVTLTGTNYQKDVNGSVYYWCPSSTDVTLSATVEAVLDNVTITKVVFWSYDGTNYSNSLEDTEDPYVCYAKSQEGGRSLISNDWTNKVQGYRIAKVEVYGTINDPDAIVVNEVTPVTVTGAKRQWEFTMPDDYVELTAVYAEATIYDADGDPVQAYPTLKEAFQAVQNGETIVLDYHVDMNGERLETSTTGSGVKFTLDLNGYTIDASGLTTACIMLYNAGDQMTIIDSSTEQTGGIKGSPSGGNGATVIFDGGRYNFGNGNVMNAEYINKNWDLAAAAGWTMADGKEFVDLNNGNPDTDGFMVRVALKTYELAIDKGRFATFYADQNVTLTEGQNIGFYTISSIDPDRTEATVAQINSTIIPAGTPALVYNGGNQKQTVKLKVTTDAVNLSVQHAPEFQGTATAKPFTTDDMDDYDYYALSGGKAFARVYEPGKIGANKCWLQFSPKGNGTRSIMLVFDDATAIDHSPLTIDNSDGDIYDLNGRKIVHGTSSNGTLRKGVYVKDGNKVVIK